MSNKLFLWTDVLHNYTSGVAFAMAETAEEAREMIVEQFDLGRTHYFPGTLGLEGYRKWRDSGMDSEPEHRFWKELHQEEPEVIEGKYAHYEYGSA